MKKSNNTGTIPGFARLLSRIVGDVSRFNGEHTIVQEGSNYRIIPQTIVSEKAHESTNMYIVSNYVLDLFMSYYLNAIHNLANVHNVKLKEILKQVQLESITRNIPDTKSIYNRSDFNFKAVGLEENSAVSPQLESIKADNKIDDYISGRVYSTAIDFGVDKDDKPVKVNLNLTASLSVMKIKSESLVALMANETIDRTVLGRLNKMYLGVISVSDFLFCGDLINLDTEVSKDKQANRLSTLLNTKQNKTLAINTVNALAGDEYDITAISSIYIITKEEQNKLENDSGKSLDNFHNRDNLLSSISCMILVIMDEIDEDVVIYMKGLEDEFIAPYKSLEKAIKNKDNSNDIMKKLKKGRTWVI